MNRLVLDLDEALTFNATISGAVRLLREAGARVMSEYGVVVVLVDETALLHRPWARDAWRTLCDEATVARLYVESGVGVKAQFRVHHPSPLAVEKEAAA